MSSCNLGSMLFCLGQLHRFRGLEFDRPSSLLGYWLWIRLSWCLWGWYDRLTAWGKAWTVDSNINIFHTLLRYWSWRQEWNIDHIITLVFRFLGLLRFNTQQKHPQLQVAQSSSDSSAQPEHKCRVQLQVWQSLFEDFFSSALYLVASSFLASWPVPWSYSPQLCPLHPLHISKLSSYYQKCFSPLSSNSLRGKFPSLPPLQHTL